VLSALAALGCGRVAFDDVPLTGDGGSNAAVSITYPKQRIAAIVGSMAVDLYPAVTGTGLSFSVTPNLPNGLTFDPATGVIMGVPLAAVDRVDYTVTASGPMGTATATFMLTALPGYEVDVQLDANDDDVGANATCLSTAAGGCTLRAAMQTAMARSTKQLIMISVGTYRLASALPTVTNNVVIVGEGGVTIQSETVAAGYRVISINDAHSARLENLTIRDFGNLDGGVAYVDNGSLEVYGCTFDNNTTASSGGVFYFGSGAQALIEASIFTNNTALTGNGWGGVIDGEQAGTTITVRRSVATLNSAVWGSFSHITSGTTLTIENSTFHHNVATTAGTFATPGGVYFLTNDTIVLNTNTNGTPESAGIYLYSVPAHYTVKNTLVAYNTDVNGAPANCRRRDLGTSLTSQGGNLFSDDALNCAQYFPGEKLSTDPLLDKNGAGNHGGPTDTYLLPAGSPAIDSGVAAGCPTVDQRGLRRPAGAGCDIGAVEM